MCALVLFKILFYLIFQLFYFIFRFFFFRLKGDTKNASIIYPQRVVPKVEPNSDPQVRNQIWGPPTAPPQQRLPHRKR